MSEANSAERAELLGTDLCALLRTLGAPVTGLAPITALPSPVRGRAAFRIELADGRRLKGRRLKSAERAEVVHRLRGAIGGGFAPILARRGDAMLLEWVEGESLDSLAPLPPALLRRCGAMLGALHRLRVDAPPGVEPRGPRELLTKLERDAEELVVARRLEPELAARAREAAAAERPAEATRGVIHKDFCAENLVRARSGEIVCVDDATLSFGPHALDLARTWWRWPMTPAERAHFSAGYREQQSLEPFARHFRFWVVCVLVAAAATRLRSRAPGSREAIDALRRLLAPAEASHPEALA
jgi:hypothetical protein